MTTEELQAIFEKYDDDFLKFERIPRDRPDRLSILTGHQTITKRPDLHAFMLLDALVPGEHDMVSCAEHDEIWLEVEVKALAKVATEEDIVELMRCGVMYNEDTESLGMFV